MVKERGEIMPARKAHELVSVLILGHKYTRVHQWLDATWTRRKWRTHRIDRHHLQAIKQKYKEGSGQYKAALLHILIDFHQSFKMLYIPKDREDIKRMYLEHGVI